MSTEIEQAIYKLSIDGSDYTDGVDRVTASTRNLSTAQEKANARLNDLKETTRLIREEIKGYNKELVENTKRIAAAKEVFDLLNKSALQNKSAIAESAAGLNKLAEAQSNLKQKISLGNIALNDNSRLITAQNKTLREAETAHGGFTRGLQKTYTGLQRLAYLIPGMGIGGLVLLISGPVIKAFESFFSSLDKTGSALKDLQRVQKAVTDSLEGGSSGFQKATADVSRLRNEIQLAKDGFADKKKVVDDYNTSIGKTTGLVKDLDEAERELNKNAPDFIRAEFLKTAAEFAQGEAAKATVKKLIDQRKPESDQYSGALGFLQAGGEQILEGASSFLHGFNAYQTIGEKRKIAKAVGINEDDQIISDFEKAQNILTEKRNELFKKHPEWNIFEDTKKGKDKKAIEDDFEKRRATLKEEIAKFASLQLKDETTIRAEYKAKLDKALLDIQKDKGLKPGERTELNLLTRDLNKNELTKALKDYSDQRKAYLEKLNNELDAIDSEAALQKISNIQNDFERQRQTIIAGSEKLIAAKNVLRDKEIADIQKSNILTPEEIKTQVANVNGAVDELISQVKVHTAQQLQQLSFDTFEKLSDDLKRTLESKNFDISELSLIDIKKQTDLFLEGKISYENYQKALTKIALDESNKRDQNEKNKLRIEISRRTSLLRDRKDLTDKQQTQLLDEIRGAESQIDAIDKAGSEKDASNKNKKTNEKIKGILEYTDAIKDAVDSVVSFWQVANDAEQKAIDRSISLQEYRVTAAQRIADRGNASYLKGETDKLTALNLAKANAVKKQLGIEAAMQASGILTGITGAIAKIAFGGLGVVETITEIAVIVGALATGYGLVKTLRNQQQGFFKGTKDTGYGGNLDTQGGFTATLHPNEAVIPADKNKAYKPTVEAIYDGTISPERLNHFVKNFHTIKPIPHVNYQRIKEAAESHISNDGRMSVLLNEHSTLLRESNELQKQILKKKIHVEQTMDKNGIASMVTEHIHQMKINKKI